MKRLARRLAPFLLAAALVLGTVAGTAGIAGSTGCSTSAKSAEYKALGTVTLLHDTALQAWVKYYVVLTPPGVLPSAALAANDQKVQDADAKYQKALSLFRVAVKAGYQDPNLSTQELSNAASALADVVRSLGVKF